jgi:hypothetical protein
MAVAMVTVEVVVIVVVLMLVVVNMMVVVVVAVMIIRQELQGSRGPRRIPGHSRCNHTGHRSL